MIFGLPLSEAEFSVRQFPATGNARERLERVAKTVVTAYNVSVSTGRGPELFDRRAQINDELVGFYNEGIGMGLYTLDSFTPGGRDFWDFVDNEGRNHLYMSYIGAGLASGVFNKDFRPFLKKAHPTWGLLVLNGIGFYNAYFRSAKTISNQGVPASVLTDPFFLYCYDSGIGRALWFYTAGDPESVKSVIDAFPVERQRGLWAGIGLAATYACGVSRETLLRLQRNANVYTAALAEGSMQATHARDVAGNLPPDDTASQVLVGRPVAVCNQVSMKARDRVNGQRRIGEKHAYQVFLDDINSWIESVQTPTAANAAI